MEVTSSGAPGLLHQAMHLTPLSGYLAGAHNASNVAASCIVCLPHLSQHAHGPLVPDLHVSIGRYRGQVGGGTFTFAPAGVKCSLLQLSFREMVILWVIGFF